MTLTRDALGIFWRGEERPGVIAYGLWSPPVDSEPPFPQHVWPEGAAHSSTLISGPWAGEAWESREPWAIVRWDVCVPRWPDADRWRPTLEATLGALVEGGARVAWFGLEGKFVEPPALFDPDEMEGGVWAALVPGRPLVCRSEIDGPFTPLAADDLVELRRLVPR